jgi:hypothetical protein
MRWGWKLDRGTVSGHPFEILRFVAWYSSFWIERSYECAVGSRTAEVIAVGMGLVEVCILSFSEMDDAGHKAPLACRYAKEYLHARGFVNL